MDYWQLLSLVLSVVLLAETTESGMVNVCSDLDNCVACTESYVHIFSFREHCRWCYATSTCGGPIACPSGSATAQRDAFKCPQKASVAKGRRYTDKLGRSLYALNLAAKQKSPAACLNSTRPDVKLYKYYEVDCDQTRNTCAGMLAVSDEAKALYVIYKGNNVDKQLFQEFVHGIAAQLGAWEKFVNGTGVMTYFHGAFTRLFLEGGMKDDLIKLREQHKDYRVWVTGHSLGGSLASMTALYLVNQTIFTGDKIKLVTFGEPRTGNYLFAKAIEKNLNFRYRVIHRNDALTNIPASVDPDNMFLSVASAERQPFFYRFAVHYDNDMTREEDQFELCEHPEDHHCRNLALAVDVNDHLTYFGVKADDFLKAGCPKSMLL
ncbi:Lipase, class 3 family-containing protein [Aphelenchoides besseyi]|nr:Lipase, class 3 family-containing protein [Aphelenchoides besseyi]KAI6226659.1 Lipase, class 3 family-containing protein [Aphelenchoides besseyi]